jgi:hypothetical protein
LYEIEQPIGDKHYCLSLPTCQEWHGFSFFEHQFTSRCSLSAYGHVERMPLDRCHLRVVQPGRARARAKKPAIMSMFHFDMLSDTHAGWM